MSLNRHLDKDDGSKTTRMVLPDGKCIGFLWGLTNSHTHRMLMQQLRATPTSHLSLWSGAQAWMCWVLCSVAPEAAPKVPTNRVSLRLGIFLVFLRLLQNSRPRPGSLSTPRGHPHFLTMGPFKHSSFPLQEGPGPTWGAPLIT